METPNYPDPYPLEVGRNAGSGSQESRDRHAQTQRVENKRLSTRFFPRHFVNEKNYPDAVSTPNQLISQWLSSAACGIKKYGGFINHTPQPNGNSDN